VSVQVVDAVLAAAKSKSGGSPWTFVVIIGLFALAYFLFIRPRTQRQRQQRAQLKAASVGDEIATIGGLVGTIVSEDGDRVTVSTGNGTELVFLRQAIGRKLTPPADPVEDDGPGTPAIEEDHRTEPDEQ
jgi:preprotein translocase subunit YajC